MGTIPAARLNPVFDYDGEFYVMMTQYMAAVPAKLLRQPLWSFEARSTEIIDAIDMLLNGY